MVYKIILKDYTEDGKFVGVNLYIDGMYSGLLRNKDDLLDALLDDFSCTVDYEGIFTERQKDE